jgi:hypothetical protein
VVQSAQESSDPFCKIQEARRDHLDVDGGRPDQMNLTRAANPGLLRNIACNDRSMGMEPMQQA